MDSSVRLIPTMRGLVVGDADAVARYRSPAFARRLGERLRQEPYDIVQFDGCATAQYATRCAEPVGPSIVLRAHNDEADLWLQRSRTRPLMERLFLRIHAERLRRIERRLWLEVGGIAAITAELAQECRTRDARHVRFIPVPQRVPEKPSPSNHNVFHIGPVDWWPNRLGLHWFLDSAWPTVRRARPDLEFKIAGRGSKEFARPWNHMGVSGDGEVEDATHYMSQSGILVAPTRQGSGMPVKVEQAMALGKAIVATTVGARGLGAIPSRDLLIADSAAEFASAVIRLSEDSRLTAAIGQSAWEFARTHFESRAVGDQIAQLYHSLRPSP